MREHLLLALKNEKLRHFYLKRNAEKLVTYKETSSPWNKSQHSARLESKTTQK